MRFAKRSFYFIVTLFLMVASQSALAQGIRYFYDDLDRLTEVVDASGNVATYSYDAVGNLLSIARSTTSGGALAVFSFSPAQAGVGQAVTIQGQGFSTTPSADTVKFNGIPATVVSATTTTLVATVPAGATTGPISVTVGASTALGPSNFTVVVVLASITVTPASASIPAGTKQQFTATGNFSDGSTKNLTASVTWTSSSTAVATISNATGSQGLATTVVIGTTTITATLGAVAGSVTLTVTPPVLASIAVTPASPSFRPGLNVKFVATGTLTDGTTVVETTAVTWTSSNPAVATISNATGSQGLATTVAAGTTMITATLGTVVGSTTLTVPVLVSIAVTPANPSFASGLAVQAVATGTFADSETGDLTTAVTWSSSNPAVATISNASGSQGLVTTVAGGTTTIQATLGLVSGSTLFTVTGAPPPPPTFAPRFALVTSSGFGGAISSFAVDAATGLFRRTMGYVNVSGAAASAVDPLGQFAYFTGNVTGGFIGFSIDPKTAALTPIPGSPFPPFSMALDLPGSLTVDPTGKFVFVTGTQGLYAYTIGTGGALTEVTGSPFLTGANSSPSSVTVDPSGKFVYVANSAKNNLSAFSIDPISGALTPVSGSPFATGSAPVSVTIDPSGRFLYVADQTFSASNNVSAFAISSTSGALTPISGSPFTAGAFPLWVTVEPSGKFLYVLNIGSGGSSGPGNVSAFVIDGVSGALSPVPGSPFPVGTQLHSMTVDPSGKFLYVAGGTSFLLPCCVNDVTMYTIDPASGALTGLRTFRTRGNAASIAFTRSSTPLAFVPKFAYVANEGDNTISASSINPTTGLLTPVPSSPFAAGTGPLSVTSDPAGKFSYVANQVAGTISAYSIDPVTGAILQTTGSPFLAGSGPASVTVDPSGRFAYAANQVSNTVSAYSILSTSGALTPITGSPFALPLTSEKGPFSVTVEPRGLFAYIANQGSSDIANFLINSTTGGLSNGNSTLIYVPGGSGSAPVSVAVDPTGNFVYVANSGSNNVSAYSIADPAGGTLSLISGSPFPAGSNPSSLTVDPSGKFLYVANAGSNNVSAYSINPTTGVLAAVAGSPFAAGTKPSAVAVDFSGKFLYVTNSGDNTVSEFSINQSTGALSPVPASTAPTGANPQSIVTTGTIQ